MVEMLLFWLWCQHLKIFSFCDPKGLRKLLKHTSSYIICPPMASSLTSTQSASCYAIWKCVVVVVFFHVTCSFHICLQKVGFRYSLMFWQALFFKHTEALILVIFLCTFEHTPTWRVLVDWCSQTCLWLKNSFFSKAASITLTSAALSLHLRDVFFTGGILFCSLNFVPHQSAHHMLWLNHLIVLFIKITFHRTENEDFESH